MKRIIIVTVLTLAAIFALALAGIANAASYSTAPIADEFEAVEDYLRYERGYDFEVDPYLYSVEDQPFQEISDCCTFAAAAISTDGEYEGAVSFAIQISKGLQKNRPVAWHTVFHELGHAINPDAPEPVVDAWSLDETRNFYRYMGWNARKVNLGLLQLSYWEYPKGGSKRVLAISKARSYDGHPFNQSAQRVRREWFLTGKVPNYRPRRTVRRAVFVPTATLPAFDVPRGW